MKSGVTLTLAWTDGTEMDYTHWCGDDKCVRMKRYCDYRWSDRTCTRQYTYVCRVGMYTAFSVCFNKETFIDYKLGGGGYKMKKKTCIQNSLSRQGKSCHAPAPPHVFFLRDGNILCTPISWIWQGQIFSTLRYA